jgi:hypothetical protein
MLRSAPRWAPLRTDRGRRTPQTTTHHTAVRVGPEIKFRASDDGTDLGILRWHCHELGGHHIRVSHSL